MQFDYNMTMIASGNPQLPSCKAARGGFRPQTIRYSYSHLYLDPFRESARPRTSLICEFLGKPRAWEARSVLLRYAQPNPQGRRGS